MKIPQKVLLIIDVQYKFRTVNSQLVEKVCTLINKYKKKNLPILVLEYGNHGHTARKVRVLLKNYANARYLTKWQDDGSSVIFDYEYLTDKKCEFFLEVCGVNLFACVERTICGLYKQRNIKQITIVHEATNCQLESAGEKSYVKQYFKRKKKIQVI